ncbi:MAG: hypothetical protein LBU95_05060 [Rikenellaceae bacterium]|jgi:hypothetical protein|nr:hypothetical protein [Rikenellaceae bacterium]
MIDIQAKIHDRFSVEFKAGFIADRDAAESDFAINTWMFIPNSLDINPLTYSKNQFYRDIRSNIRLITPVFLLRDIAGGSAVPLRHLREAFTHLAERPTRDTVAEYEYHIKMFTAIVKSAMRDEILRIVGTARPDDMRYLCGELVANIENITSHYRTLQAIITQPTIPPAVQDYFRFGDEFISNVIELQAFKLVRHLQGQREPQFDPVVEKLTGLIRTEVDYKRSQGYLVVDPHSPTGNRELMFRFGVLKKYAESELFLEARRKKDGVLVEQVYYSLAAGLSMIFATTVAFSVQQRYGNFTMPLFVALVVSYMLKDRIKELMRYYFAHRLGTRYFDNKTTVGVQDREIGWVKEAMDFIGEAKAPREVMEIRSRTSLLEAENRVNDEKILLYRKMVHIDREQLEAGNQYAITGINDIMRLHFSRFTQKMDNPEAPLHIIDDQGNTVLIEAQKIYYINLVLQLQSAGQVTYKRYRLVVARDGIREIEEMK